MTEEIKFRVQYFNLLHNLVWSTWMTEPKEILKFDNILSIHLNETLDWNDPRWKQLAKELNECLSPLNS